MKVSEIINVVSGWRKEINQHFKEIAESPELIKTTLSFNLVTGFLNKAQIHSILNDPACWYAASYPVEEFTIDDTYTKTIETLPFEDLLRYESGRLMLDVTFYYNFYKYDKFNCCTYEIDEEDYEKAKYEAGMCQSAFWRNYFEEKEKQEA